MIKTLVAIEVDLASSFAIRYACQLGKLIPMEIHPVSVKFPSPEIPMTGAGWVRHTWEREVVAMGKTEIEEMLAAEKASCPVLKEPRVIYGERETELLHIVEQEAFDLYIEGAPFPFTPASIYKRLHAKFYQHLTCPLIWLRSVREINRVLVWCADPASAGVLVETMGRLWAGGSITLDLAYPGDRGTLDMRPVAEKAAADLQALGCQARLAAASAPDGDGPLLPLVQEAGLVAVALEKELRKDHPVLPWLARTSTPVMVRLF